MNGNCDTKVKQILDAIEYGKLLPADTEKRLLDMIECEINKEDTAADMGLISIAQDLLFEMHNLSCERTEESERRLDQLRKRISATVAKRAKREAYGNAMRRVIKIGAAVAVFVLLVVGMGYPLQLTWFESWSTPGEQQRVVQLHAVTLDMVSQAIAEKGALGLQFVQNVNDFDNLLCFDIDMPASLREEWFFSEGNIQYYSDSIELVMRYVHSEHKDKSVTCNVTLYTDSEVAWFMFEQSHEGESVSTNGYEIYVSKNVDKASAVWHHETTILHLSGDVTEEEIVMLTLEIIGGRK